MITTANNKFPLTTKRESSLDVMRGIAMFFVVYTHFIQGMYSHTKGNFFNDYLIIFASTFQMPCFAIVSGYLFQKSFVKQNKSMLRHRVSGLLQPLFVFSTFYWLLQEILFFAKFKTVQFSWQIIFESFCGSFLWFLWALLYIMILISFSRFASSKMIPKHQCFLTDSIFLLISLLLLFPVAYLPNGQYALFLYPFFVIGMFLDKISSKLKWDVTWFHMVMLFLFIFLLFFWTKDIFIYISGASLFRSEYAWYKQLYINFFRTLIGLTGTYLIFWVSRKICKKKILSAIFVSLGSKTLEMYTLQCFFVSLLVPILFNKCYPILSQYTNWFSNKKHVDFLFVSIGTCVALGIMFMVIRFTERFQFIHRILWR